jgi:hypothetical protein
MRIELKILLGLTACVAALAIVYGQETPSKPPEKSQSSGTPAPQPQTTNVTTKSDFPVIGYIEKRGKTITIKAGPKGPLYSVKTTEGKVLFEDLSAEQLRAQAPELQEFLKSAVASDSGSLDARVRVRPVVADAALRGSAAR